MTTIAYLGPPGTFGEEALLTQTDLADADLVSMTSMPEVLRAVDDGEVDAGFVALENAIEGTVNVVLDALVFDRNLLIQREVVLPIRMHLLGPSGLALPDVRRVVSFPVALAQCRQFFGRALPAVEEVPANSTASAVRMVGEDPDAFGPGTAALGTALAAKLYGLEVIAEDVEDHDDNATRFVLVTRPSAGIPPVSGHDRTSIVCFQRADRPGSLHAILGQFSARNLNLTKLESRPTKRGLGEYCFIIDIAGHVDDEVVADCLRDLHAQLAGVKFLGSYPAWGEHGETIRRDATAAWEAADSWIGELRARVRR
ncbi:MAG: prephenate dehydratase [Acidimicrobiales bacterium]|nr:prephenate dehydratase [Acidimicrobiales bacterium]